MTAGHCGFEVCHSESLPFWRAETSVQAKRTMLQPPKKIYPVLCEEAENQSTRMSNSTRSSASIRLLPCDNLIGPLNEKFATSSGDILSSLVHLAFLKNFRKFCLERLSSLRKSLLFQKHCQRTHLTPAEMKRCLLTLCFLVFLLVAHYQTAWTMNTVKVSCFDELVTFDIRKTTPKGLISPPYVRFWASPYNTFYTRLEREFLLPVSLKLMQEYRSEIILSYFRSICALFSYARIGSPIIQESICTLIDKCTAKTVDQKAAIFHAIHILFTIIQYFLNQARDLDQLFSLVLFLLRLQHFWKKISEYTTDVVHNKFRTSPSLAKRLKLEFWDSLLVLLCKRTLLHGLAFLSTFIWSSEVAATLISWSSFAFHKDYDYQLISFFLEDFGLDDDTKLLIEMFLVQQLISFGCHVIFCHSAAIRAIKFSEHIFGLFPFVVVFVLYYAMGRYQHAAPFELKVSLFHTVLPFYALQKLLIDGKVKYQIIIKAYHEIECAKNATPASCTHKQSLDDYNMRRESRQSAPIPLAVQKADLDSKAPKNTAKDSSSNSETVQNLTQNSHLSVLFSSVLLFHL